jgi:molybdopterin-synthase adenylyltransferase
MAKVESAKQTLAAINPDVRLIPHPFRLTVDNALDLIADYDVVADGSDNFSTRFLVNDACYFTARPLVSGAVLRFDGQLATFKATRRPKMAGTAPAIAACSANRRRRAMPTCAEAGVLGAWCGTIGSLQATEVIKEILGIGEGLSGWLLVCDALSAEFRKIRVRRDPECPLCGDAPTITSLDAPAAGHRSQRG